MNTCQVGIMRLVGGSDPCPVHVTLKCQPSLPQHSPPLLSSKHRSKQAKLGGTRKAVNTTAKQPHLEATEHTSKAGDDDMQEEEMSGHSLWYANHSVMANAF
jgi:hypothetical protein